MKYLVLILILALAGCYEEVKLANFDGQTIDAFLVMETNTQIVYRFPSTDDVKKFRSLIQGKNYTIQSFADSHGSAYITVNKPPVEPEESIKQTKQRALSKLTEDEKKALNLK